MSALQEAFLEHGAVQCGFFTPGQIMAADDLLRRSPNPTMSEIQEGLAGNYCRCHCYYQICDAVAAVAAAGPTDYWPSETRERRPEIPQPPVDQ